MKWFRPPFGARSRSVLRTAAELGLTPVMWNVTSYDWEATAPGPLEARVQRGIHHNQLRSKGSNILLHDGGHERLGTDRSVAVTATRSLLEQWHKGGLRLVTVNAWGKPAT